MNKLLSPPVTFRQIAYLLFVSILLAPALHCGGIFRKFLIKNVLHQHAKIILLLDRYCQFITIDKRLDRFLVFLTSDKYLKRK